MAIVDPTRTPAVDSKEAVLDAAQRLINQYGYDGFSMRDLAQQSGLAKATLYHHFEDKRQIFFQVLERDLYTVRDHLVEAAQQPGDLATRLRHIVLAFFALANERGVMLLSTLRQAAGMEHEFCHLMRNYHSEIHHPIAALLNEAMARGEIRTINTELTTMSLFSILQVLASRHLLMNDLELDTATADFVVDLMMSGLLPPPPSS